MIRVRPVSYVLWKPLFPRSETLLWPVLACVRESAGVDIETGGGLDRVARTRPGPRSLKWVETRGMMVEHGVLCGPAGRLRGVGMRSGVSKPKYGLGT